jgi:hypothetical protein
MNAILGGEEVTWFGHWKKFELPKICNKKESKQQDTLE